ncbi:MAG: DegT/DnrJ/EryC1/StrS family aminotransferase [Rickettsiales bacterium]|nr:DegT/DnrJ/EryC1/StrS family aminotransferase [Rickettsiales bacterium]
MKKIHLAEDTISRDEIVDLSKWLLTANKLTKGPLTKEFEEKFAKWQGSKYAVYVNSGSSANHLMAYALLEGGYLKNKVAIAPSVSWCTSVTPFIQFGYDVHLCDCDKDDLGLNVEHFEKLCKEYNPSVVLGVHVLGHPIKLDKILEICKKYGVILLEDTCESMATEYKNKKLGSFGLAGSFSLYYGHHISTVEGGMVVTDDEKFYNLCLSIRSHGWSRDVEPNYKSEWSKGYDIDEIRDLYTFYFPGFNFRNTDIGAFLGLSQLKKIDGYAKIRERNYKIYREELKDYWAQTSGASFLSHFAYGVLVENRLEVYKHLLDNGIENRPLICGNIGLHPVWIKKYGKTSLPVADIVHFYGLYLPNHAQLNEEEVRFICKKFKEVAIAKKF